MSYPCGYEYLLGQQQPLHNIQLIYPAGKDIRVNLVSSYMIYSQIQFNSIDLLISEDIQTLLCLGADGPRNPQTGDRLHTALMSSF